MEIIKNSIVNRTGCYYESGGLVIDTQRIPYNHQNEYWQQANVDTKLSISKNKAEISTTIESALYIGRIQLHFGHFIMEGMPRLCEVPNINLPILGYITKGGIARWN